MINIPQSQIKPWSISGKQLHASPHRMCAAMDWWCMLWHPCSYVTPTSWWERAKERERGKKINEIKGRKKSWAAMWLNLQILYWQQRRENRRDSKRASLAPAGIDGSHLLWWSFSDLVGAGGWTSLLSSYRAASVLLRRQGKNRMAGWPLPQ